MDSNKNEIRDIKVILLGENGVGKTSIINRYINDEFNPDGENETIGATFLVKELRRSNIIYNLRIWDSTGQEKFHSVTKLFIKGSNIIILVYSINSRESFDNLNFWYSSIKDIMEENNFILAIVASKNDLKDEEVISEEEGKKYAEDKKAIFRTVSAKEDGPGINKLFDILLDELTQINYESRTESYRLEKRKLKNKTKKQHFC